MRPYLLVGDGGTARHIATGLYIINHHQVPTTNYVWALDPNASWTTHELIGDLLLAGAYQLGGLNGVVLLSSLGIAVAVFIAVAAASKRGVGLIFGSITGLLAVAACSLHWSARAHLFSYAMLAGLYYLVYETSMSANAKAIRSFALFALWSNVHGSTVLGMLLLGFLVLEALLKPAEERKPAFMQSALMLGAAVLGSFFTVRGLGLVSYVVNYFFHPSIRNQSDEWRSLDFSLGFPVWSFLSLLALLIAIWTYSPRKPRLSEFLFVLTLGFGGLYAMRLVPYFAVIAIPAAAYCWPALREQWYLTNRIKPLTKLLLTDAKFDSDLKFGRFLIVSGVLVALAASTAFMVAPNFKLSGFDSARLPVESVAWLKANNMHGVGFTRDNWGGYVNLETNDKIFIDDKTDFYPPAVVQDYASLYLSYPEWRKVLDKYKFQYILIPNDIPLAYLLSADGQWKKAHEDSTASVFIPARGQEGEKQQ